MKLDHLYLSKFRVIRLVLPIIVISMFGISYQSSTWSDAGANTAPVCKSTQLRVLVSANTTTTSTVSAEMSFLNAGPACYTLGNQPQVQPVEGAHRRAVGPGTANSLVLTPSIHLLHNQRVMSELSVVIVSASKSSSCKPESANGVKISDGLPINSYVYVKHSLTHLCTSPYDSNVLALYYVRIG